MYIAGSPQLLACRHVKEFGSEQRSGTVSDPNQRRSERIAMADKLVSRIRIKRQIRIVGDLAYVTLTRGLEAIIDADDVGLVSDRNWFALVGKYGHAYAIADRGTLMHRVLLAPESKLDIDHIDGNGLNNRRENIRIATRQQNMANKKVDRRAALQTKGVYMDRRRKKFRACIKSMGKSIHLGTFETLDEASEAYRRAAKGFWGEFAKS